MGVVAVTLLLGAATAAFAFTAQSGFSATTYASGYPTGGPSGVAFVSGAMYTVDPADSGLYMNAASGAPTRVGTVPGTPTGLASFGPSLYAIDSASRKVVQLDPATGGVLATLGGAADFGGAQLTGIATDPVTGDIYVVTSTGFLYEIPAVAPRTPAFVLVLTAQPSTFALAVASDHSIYVAVEGAVHGIWQITPAPAHAQSLIGPDFVGARGVGVIPGFIFVNNADGSILKIVIPGAGTGTTSPALVGGAAGSSAAIGTDGCFYASQGATVVRLANTDGSCNLANAAPPPPPATLTLSRISSTQPLIGNGDQSFTATIGNATGTANVPVTFTVTNSLGATTTYNALTSNNGVASFSYAASVVGTDSIRASATVNGTPITSNVVTITYLRALDTVPPIITYTVTGTAGANFACPSTTLGTLGVKEYCGWYVSPPTVHFTVTRGVGGTTDPIYSCPDFTLSVNSPIDGTPTTCNATNADGKPSTFTVVLQALITHPTVVASGSTASGPYVPGTWTNQNVTVSYSCATDPNLGPAGIPPGGCSPAQIVSAEGSTSVSGSVLDIAGTRVPSAPFLVNIDKTPPVVTIASTRTADGAAYLLGTPTTQNVTVTFACADALDPNPTCPGPVTVTSGPSVTVSASDRAGNSRSYTFNGINIDRSGPAVTATITPAPDANGNNALTATVTVGATDPSGVASITYSASGAQSIPSTTVLASGNPTTFTVPVALNVVGTTTVTYTAIDGLGNRSITGSATVKILATQPTTLAVASATSVVTATGGDVTVVARLAITSGDVAVPGETVIVTVGGQTFTGVTDAAGLVRGTVSLAPGMYPVTASYAGGAAYVASRATASVKVDPLVTSLSCSTGPIVIGLPLQITATLTQAATGAALPGKAITFTVGSLALAVTPARTDGSGTQRALSAPLPAGTLAVAVQFTGDGTYAQTSCLIQSGAFTIDGDQVGKITAGGAVNGSGSGGFNVDGDADGVKGELQWKSALGDLHAHTMTSVGVSSDCRKGSFSGVLDDGRRFYAYVEDNGEPGRGADRLLLWAGDLFTPLVSGDGYLTKGNIQIHNERTDCGKPKAPKKGVIVVFKDSTPAADKTNTLETRHGFSADARFGAALHGFSAQLSDDQIAAIAVDPDVAFVSEDRTVDITGGSVPLAAKDTTPTGILRTGAATTTTVHQASTIAVAILDTGIALTHPDLNAANGTNCVAAGTTANDDNGHGTHIAGTIGAKNNGAGVVGVAPGTKVYAVKVLNSSGSGTWSQIICGLDWLTANAASLNIKVANLSLGGSGANDNNCGNTNADALHRAICRTVAAGVTIVVAAGNGAADLATQVPAAYPEVLTVTAMSDSDGKSGGTGGVPSCAKTEKDDSYSVTSNYAKSPADVAHVIAGPGVCINSTWLSGTYKVLTGTSMAAPHVAGAVALCVGSGGTAGPCSGLTPAQVIAKLRSDAQSAATVTNGFLGDPTRPLGSGYYYGYLVRADKY